MSLHATRDVWQHSRARGSALLVLLAIADYANADDLAWPSLSNLATKVRMSERQVRRHLAALIQMGELSSEPNAVDRRRRLYRVTLSEPRTPSLEPHDSSGLRTQDSGPGTHYPAIHDRSSTAKYRSSMTKIPVIDDRLSATKRSSMTQIPDIHGRAYKEIEPSMNYQIAIEREKNLSFLFSFRQIRRERRVVRRQGQWGGHRRSRPAPHPRPARRPTTDD